MDRKNSLIALFFATVLAGCAAMVPLSQPLEGGEGVPAGKVLVIGKFMLDPFVRQNLAGVVSLKGKEEGVIKLWMADKADSPVTAASALFGGTYKEAMDVRLQQTSFVPLAPGVRYIRSGYVTTQVAAHYVQTSRGMVPAGVTAARIGLIKDIRIEVPANAKAVYIGTIVYKHDGQRATAVRVRDEYRSALRELARSGVTGISPKDVVKRLAVVVKPSRSE